MTKTIFEEMSGTCTQVGDYLLPNIAVPAEEEKETDWFVGIATHKALKGTS